MKKLLVLFALLALIPTTYVFAKGDFAYITVKGPGIIGDLNVTNPALTKDFFAFADFSKGEVPEPANPGQGYQVVRVYVSDMKDQPFDQLYYYPYSGFVYYDRLAEGTSEYDGKWYVANPAASEPFRDALAQRALLTWIPFGVLIIALGIVFVAYNTKPKK